VTFSLVIDKFYENVELKSRAHC